MRAWSAAAEDKLRALYATTDLTRLAFLLKRTEKAIKARAAVLGLTKGVRRAWTAADDRKLRRLYATQSAAECAAQLDRTVSAVQQRVNTLGLHKPLEWVAERTHKRWAEGRHANSRKAHFRPGHESWNKGVKGVTGTHPNSRRTQFRLGRPASESRNYVPIGSEKLDTKRGVIVRKLTDDPAIVPAMRWRPVHTLVWEAAHGPVPEGHICIFRPGLKTHDTALITVDRLEVVTFAENMRRNSYHTRYPKEVAQLIQLKGALNRKINRRSKEA